MKHLLCLPTLLLVLVLQFTLLYSQEETLDSLHLKDGTTVHGRIVKRVTNEYVQIRLANGVIATYAYSHISRITQSVDSHSTSYDIEGMEKAPSSGYIAIFGGASFPTGKFSSTTQGAESGFALMGWAGGAQYNVFVSTSTFLNFTGLISFNSVNETELKKASGLHPSFPITFSQYRTIALLAGLGTGSSALTPGLYAMAHGGIMIANTPEILATQGPGKQEALSATAFAYGGTIGYLTPKIDFALRVLAGDPEYEFQGEKYTQPTSFAQLVVGIILR